MPIPLKRLWTQQPDHLCGIDRSNPITRDLVVCTNGAYDAVSEQFVPVTGDLPYSVKHGIAGLETTASGVAHHLNLEVPLLDGSNDGWTVLILGSRKGNVNTRIVCMDPDVREISAAYLDTVDARFEEGLLTGPDNNWPIGQLEYIGKRAKFSTKRVSVLVNSKEISGYTASATLGSITAGTWTVGYVDSTWQDEFWFGQVLIFNRALADAEIDSLRRNPWQVYAKRNVWIPSSVGGGAITPSGVASSEAFGLADISAGSVSITPSGIASSEVIGAAVLSTQYDIAVTGIASLEAFGSAAITLGPVSITPTGIGSSEAFGAADVTTGIVTISPTGIATNEAFGTTTITGVITLYPSGIVSHEAVGTPQVVAGSVTLFPAGISSEEALGVPSVDDGTTQRPRWFIRMKGQIIGTITPIGSRLKH